MIVHLQFCAICDINRFVYIFNTCSITWSITDNLLSLSFFFPFRPAVWMDRVESMEVLEAEKVNRYICIA